LSFIDSQILHNKSIQIIFTINSNNDIIQSQIAQTHPKTPKTRNGRDLRNEGRGVKGGKGGKEGKDRGKSIVST